MSLHVCKVVMGGGGGIFWGLVQFGFMPPLELLKLWMDNGFWYDRTKQEVKKILNMQLLCAMAPPGGGRNRISQRIQACFSLVTFSQKYLFYLSSISIIYMWLRETCTNFMLHKFEESISMARLVEVFIWNKYFEFLISTTVKKKSSV